MHPRASRQAAATMPHSPPHWPCAICVAQTRREAGWPCSTRAVAPCHLGLSCSRSSEVPWPSTQVTYLMGTTTTGRWAWWVTYLHAGVGAGTG